MEQVPQENETIAVKRAVRLAEKIRAAREGLSGRKAWWNNGPMEILVLVILLSLNFYLVQSFFGTTAPDIAYSGPIVPLFGKLIEFMGIPLGYSFQIVHAVFFLMFPVTFFVFIRSLTDRKLIAFIAVLIASLPFSPFGLTRIWGMFLGGDGPHLASLTLIPLALYGLLAFLRKGGLINLILASITSCFIALTSPFGFLTYALLASITAFSEMLLGTGRLKAMRFLVALFFAGAFSSFWYNPVFFYWMITGPMGIDVRLMISKMIPISLFAIPILGAFGFLLFDRKPSLQPVFLASFYTIAFLLIFVAGGGIFPSHPSRYTAELGISLSFMISVAIVKGTDYLRFHELSWLTKTTKALVANGILVGTALILILGIVFGKQSVVSAKEGVLGVWSGVDKGDIWVSKENFGGFSTAFGFSITAGAVATLSFLGVKSKKEPMSP